MNDKAKQWSDPCPIKKIEKYIFSVPFLYTDLKQFPLCSWYINPCKAYRLKLRYHFLFLDLNSASNVIPRNLLGFFFSNSENFTEVAGLGIRGFGRSLQEGNSKLIFDIIFWSWTYNKVSGLEELQKNLIRIWIYTWRGVVYNQLYMAGCIISWTW